MDSILLSALAGACGGFSWFLVGIRFRRIRNNKYFRKATIEILGGTLAGLFIVIPIIPVPQYTVSFLVGAAWSAILQHIREIITKRIKQEISRKGE